jgi:hypothetical protein
MRTEKEEGKYSSPWTEYYRREGGRRRGVDTDEKTAASPLLSSGDGVTDGVSLGYGAIAVAAVVALSTASPLPESPAAATRRLPSRDRVSFLSLGDRKREIDRPIWARARAGPRPSFRVGVRFRAPLFFRPPLAVLQRDSYVVSGAFPPASKKSAGTASNILNDFVPESR